MNLAALEPQAREIIQRYDEPRAAMLPLLWLVQENVGHISPEAEFWVGRLVGVAVSHVREVVSFYSMFRTTSGGTARASRLHEPALHVARGRGRARAARGAPGNRPGRDDRRAAS